VCAGDPAKDVLKDSLQDLMVMCQNVRGTFDTAVADFRRKNAAEAMDIDLSKK
jgi:DNA-directed RNA polymerases I and III subunit RPAC2